MSFLAEKKPNICILRIFEGEDPIDRSLKEPDDPIKLDHYPLAIICGGAAHSPDLFLIDTRPHPVEFQEA